MPSLDIGYVTLATGDFAFFEESFATALRTLTTLPAPTTAPVLAEDPAKRADLTGTFDDPHLVGTIAIKLDAGRLAADVAAWDKTQYAPVLVERSARNYTLEVVGPPSHPVNPVPLTFILDASGKAEYIRSATFVAKRRAPGTPPPSGTKR